MSELQVSESKCTLTKKIINKRANKPSTQQHTHKNPNQTKQNETISDLIQWQLPKCSIVFLFECYL